MTTLFRWPGGWDPFGTLRTMQRELERATGVDLFGDARRVGGGSYPPVNIFTGTDEVVVQSEVPGVLKEDLDISITGDTLVIKGTKREPQMDKPVRYQRRERGYGEFMRTIVLPDQVEPDRVEAEMEAGVLTVRLPKTQAAKPRQVAIK